MSDRFEQQYPVTAREKEIKQILQFVTHGQSCQIISVPGAGRSTVLRLLTYNKQLLTHHLKTNNATMKQSNNYLFVYVNFAEIAGFETSELHKFLFLSLLSSIEIFHPRGVPQAQHHLGGGRMDSPEVNVLYNELYVLFKEALKLADPLVMFQNLKKAIQLCNSATMTTIFLFDRFSEFADKTTNDFFTGLKSLRTASGGKLTVVFSTHRPLENLLPVEHWKDFYEFFVGNHIFLDLYDKEATGFRIAVLEKEYGKKLPPKTKDEIIKLTGGHGKLVKLTTQILISSPPPRGWPNGLPRGEMLADSLLSHILIRGSLLEIWQALTGEERQLLREEKTNQSLKNLGLPFPLLIEFIKRNIAEELIPKTIRFSEKQNEIYFGDEPLSGLTNYEFRLLKHLIANPHRVCDREEIITAVYSDTKTSAGVSDEAVDQMVHRLRKKIEDEADNPKHLLTVKGRGFRFIP